MSTYDETIKKFIAVRDLLLEESRADPHSITARAYRMAFSVPLLFYKDKTIQESIDALKARAAE